MPRNCIAAATLALPFTFMSHVALADLTPAQVWGDWKTYLEGFGYEVQAAESTSGDTLTVSDLDLIFPIPEAEGAFSMSMGTIAFTQNSDGTVGIILPDRMPITIEGRDVESGAEPFKVNLTYAQTGHAMTASGAPDRMTYVYTAGGVTMTMDQVQVGDVVRPPEEGRFSAEGTNLSMTTTMTLGELRGYEQTGSVEALSYALFVDDRENNTKVDMQGSMSGISVDGTGMIPMQIDDAADMAAMLAAGFAADGTIGYTGGSFMLASDSPDDGSFTLQSASEGGDLGVKMGSGGLAYDVAQRNLDMSVTVDGMPFPFEVSFAESGFNLALPVQKSDTPQDFALGINMGNFTMSDFIWSMFDPGAQLPRDPASVVVDVAGKVQLLVDWMNPDAAAQMAGAPGKLQTLAVNTLLVDAVGAKLEGSGDIVINEQGPALVPGVGTPVGEVNLALAGGNGLLDKLVSMGLLPEEQAMGARMMMGLFTVPGTAPDTLSSKIEFTQDGQILANGQRIR